MRIELTSPVSRTVTADLKSGTGTSSVTSPSFSHPIILYTIVDGNDNFFGLLLFFGQPGALPSCPGFGKYESRKNFCFSSDFPEPPASRESRLGGTGTCERRCGKRTRIVNFQDTSLFDQDPWNLGFTLK